MRAKQCMVIVILFIIVMFIKYSLLITTSIAIIYCCYYYIERRDPTCGLLHCLHSGGKSRKPRHSPQARPRRFKCTRFLFSKNFFMSLSLRPHFENNAGLPASSMLVNTAFCSGAGKIQTLNPKPYTLNPKPKPPPPTQLWVSCYDPVLLTPLPEMTRSPLRVHM